MRGLLSTAKSTNITVYIPKIVNDLNLKVKSGFVRSAIYKYLKELKKCNIEGFNEMQVTGIYREPLLCETIETMKDKIPHTSFSELARVAIVRELMMMSKNARKRARKKNVNEVLKQE